MPFADPDRTVHHLVSRRRFLKHAGVGAAGMAAVLSGAGRARVFAAHRPIQIGSPPSPSPPSAGGPSRERRRGTRPSSTPG